MKNVVHYRSENSEQIVNTVNTKCSLFEGVPPIVNRESEHFFEGHF